MGSTVLEELAFIGQQDQPNFPENQGTVYKEKEKLNGVGWGGEGRDIDRFVKLYFSTVKMLAQRPDISAVATVLLPIKAAYDIVSRNVYSILICIV